MTRLKDHPQHAVMGATRGVDPLFRYSGPVCGGDYGYPPIARRSR
jgi:hypothetical protein